MFVVLALFVACATVPGSHFVKGPQPSDLRFTVMIGEKPNQEKLRQLVLETVTRNFGNVMDVDTTVWWVDQELRWWAQDKETNKRLDYKTNYWGLCFGCDEIYVLDRNKSICDTSYIHELIHCYHAKVEGWRDFKHEHKKWWDLVKTLQAECRAQGW